MTLTYRRVKGSQLTSSEADANVDHLLLSANHTFAQSGTTRTGTPLARTVSNKLTELVTTADYTGAAAGMTGVGTNVLAANTSGIDNTAFGESALKVNTTGSGNSAFGFEALKANTIGGATSGNSAFGCTSMLHNISGDNNSAFGVDSLFTNTTGSNNSAFGSNALGFGDGGDSNSAFGWRSLFNGGAGSANSAFGLTSLNTFTSGSYNAAFGTSALFSLDIGSSNTGVGSFALYAALGSGNVGLGYFAGKYETGSNSFYVDNQDRTNEANGKISALLYGVFNASPSSQTLRVNGKLGIDATPDADGKLKIAVTAGATAALYVSNASNTAGSGSRVFVDVAGASGDDPWALFFVQGVGGWSVGLDNSDSDKFKVSYSATLGTSDALTITTGGVVTIPNLAGVGSRAVKADANGVLSAP